MLYSKFQELPRPAYPWQEFPGTWLCETAKGSLIFNWLHVGWHFPSLGGGGGGGGCVTSLSSPSRKLLLTARVLCGHTEQAKS